MSEYELISLYHEAVGLFTTMLTTLMSLVFAYLVAMFFMAHRLGLALFWLLNILYVLVAFALSTGLVATGLRAALLGEEALRRAAIPGSPIHFLDAPLYIPPDMPYAMRAFAGAAVLLSLAYAFMHRRAERAARGAAA